MAAPDPRPQRELRIGDAERTAAADELAEHYAQGRLSTEEHHERLDRIYAARTRSDLTPVFADLPGSAYQRPPRYASADRPGVGVDRPRRGPDIGRRPFPGPPFGRPPFGRPSYGGPARAAARGFWVLPVLLRIVLVVLLVTLVLAQLPLILVGLLVWVLLTRRHRRWQACQRR